MHLTGSDGKEYLCQNWSGSVLIAQTGTSGSVVHLGTRGYDLSDLRAGHGRLNAIEEAELPSVAGKRILHL